MQTYLNELPVGIGEDGLTDPAELPGTDHLLYIERRPVHLKFPRNMQNTIYNQFCSKYYMEYFEMYLEKNREEIEIPEQFA